MEIKYFIEREDLWKGAKFVSKKHITKKRIYISLAVFLLVNIFFVVSEEYPMLFIEIVFLVVYIPCLFYFKMRMKRIIMNKPKRNNGVLGEHTILLSEEGFRECTEVNDSFQSWKAVSSIDFNDNYIYIVIDNTLVHIIPKRSFSTLNDSLRFEETVKELFNKSSSSIK